MHKQKIVHLLRFQYSILFFFIIENEKVMLRLGERQCMNVIQQTDENETIGN